MQASLATTRGYKATRDGKDADAANHYRAAIKIYGEMPETTATLNNAALGALRPVRRVALDREEFTRGADKLDRADALEPTNAILLLNASGTVAESARPRHGRQGVNFRALKSPGGWEVLPYLYRTPAERRGGQAARRAPRSWCATATYAEKLLRALAPARRSYQLLSGLFEHTNDQRAEADRGAR